jgi:hypothetical protein
MPKGVYERKKVRKCKTYPVSDWLELYKSGLSIYEIGRKYGSSQDTVSREIKKVTGIITHRVNNDEGSFTNSIAINSETGCWEWVGSVNNKGYGQFFFNGKKWFAHRYSYKYFVGDIGDLHVCHSCDNPKCVNPDHLFLGTRFDNMRDKVLKGRSNMPIKLSKEDVWNIKKLKADNKGNTEIARIYKIDESTVRGIITGKLHRHI